MSKDKKSSLASQWMRGSFTLKQLLVNFIGIIFIFVAVVSLIPIALLIASIIWVFNYNKDRDYYEGWYW